MARLSSCYLFGGSPGITTLWVWTLLLNPLSFSNHMFFLFFVFSSWKRAPLAEYPCEQTKWQDFRLAICLVAHPGFEPGTPWLKVKCSTDWASEPYEVVRVVIINNCESLSRVIFSLPQFWLGWKDLNPRMWESESHALPLGDTPSLIQGLAGVAGFEPTNARVKVSCLTAWLYPNIILILGWVVGVEPTTSRATIWRSNQLSYTHHRLACLKGFEPLTLALEGRCSIQLSYRHTR